MSAAGLLARGDRAPGRGRGSRCSAALAGGPSHAYLFRGPRGVGQARRGARLRGRDPRRRRRRPRGRPPPGAARSLAASRPRLAGAARRPAPGRGGARAGDPRRRLPALRRRQAGLRRRGGGGDARREPERAAEDARGAARLRPPDPAQLRAGGAAGDDRLALPAGRLRAAAGRGARGRARRWPAPTRPRTRSPPRRGSPPATSSGRGCCSASAGRELRAEAERCVAAALDGRGAPRAPWKALLDRAEAAGEDAEAAAREALEEEAKAGIKRSASEIADGAKRAGRRRRTEILDLGLELCAAWLRDLAAVAAGRRGGRLQPRPPRAAARPGRRARPGRAPAAAPSWSRRPAAAST